MRRTCQSIGDECVQLLGVHRTRSFDLALKFGKSRCEFLMELRSLCRCDNEINSREDSNKCCEHYGKPLMRGDRCRECARACNEGKNFDELV